MGTGTLGTNIKNAIEAMAPADKYDLLKVWIEAGDEIEDWTAASPLWEIDGSEAQLKTARDIDMRTKSLINVLNITATGDITANKVYNAVYN